MNYRRLSGGFALPTVVITSVVMFAILVAAVSAVTSVRTAINNQYYENLAADAAESGTTHADSCLSDNGYNNPWLNNTLTPATDCTGAPVTGRSLYLIQTANYRVTYTVGPATTALNGASTATVTGKVELLQTSNGSVWRTITSVLNIKGGGQLGAQQITFGYAIAGAGGASNAGVGRGSFFLTVSEDGVLRSVGFNGMGQLGNGTQSDTLIPTLYQLPGGQKARAMYSNLLSTGFSTFVLTQDGSLYGAGDNYYGQIGVGSSGNAITTPTLVSIPLNQAVSSVSPITGATFIVTTTGNVYSAGWCAGGLLGTGYTISGCSSQSTLQRVALPATVNGQPNTYAASVVGDYLLGYSLMQGGAVYGWGINRYGELADGTTTASSIPKLIGHYGEVGQPQAMQVVVDGQSVWILDSWGNVYGAGKNIAGELGDGTMTDRGTLTKMQFPASAAGTIKKISTDQDSLLALAGDGTVWGAGYNNFGQLGDGSTTNRSSPVQFILPSGVQAVDVYNTAYNPASTIANTYVIGSDGKVYGCGANSYGQLGNGTTTPSATPVAMSVIDGAAIRAKSVYAGYGTVVIITTDGSVYTVGNNSNGQLGDGTTNNSSVPIRAKYTNNLKSVTY